MTRIHDEELQSLVNHHNYNVFRVTWVGDAKTKWLITKNDIGIGGQGFETKRQAKKQARKIAKREENRPSVLIIERKKPGGDKMKEASVQDWVSYS